MPAPVLTVSIVTFRTDFAILKATLDSLQACTLPFEAVIIDNTVNDDYFAALQKITSIRCIRSPENGGYGTGHNMAMSLAGKAPYHLILNPDVIIHPQCLEKLAAIMNEKPDTGLAVPKIYHVNGTIQPLNKRDPTVLDLALRRFMPYRLREWRPIRQRMDHYVMMEQGYDKPYEVPYVSGCFMFFRRSVLDALGGFDQRFFMYFEDADLSRRARAITRIQYCPEAEITHRWARDAYTNRRMLLAMCKSGGQYFRKWGWKWW